MGEIEENAFSPVPRSVPECLTEISYHKKFEIKNAGEPLLYLLAVTPLASFTIVFEMEESFVDVKGGGLKIADEGDRGSAIY